jgi:hypothetical protein
MASSDWCVLVLRAWRDPDGLKIRLLSSSEAGHATAVATSVPAACELVASHLAPLADGPDERERRRADDAAVTEPDMPPPYGPSTAPDG